LKYDVTLTGVKFANRLINAKEVGIAEIKESITARKLREMKLILADLELSKAMFEKILTLDDQEENDIVMLSLWISAVLTYFRSFTCGKARTMKLSLDQNISILDDNLQKAHEELKNQRNRYMAHTDFSPYEFEFPSYVAVDIDDLSIVGYHDIIVKIILPDPEKISLYIELVNKLIEQGMDFKEQVERSLIDELKKIKYVEKA